MASRPGKSIYRWTRIDTVLLVTIAVLFAGVGWKGVTQAQANKANGNQSIHSSR